MSIKINAHRSYKNGGLAELVYGTLSDCHYAITLEN